MHLDCCSQKAWTTILRSLRYKIQRVDDDNDDGEADGGEVDDSEGGGSEGGDGEVDDDEPVTRRMVPVSIWANRRRQ